MIETIYEEIDKEIKRRVDYNEKWRTKDKNGEIEALREVKEIIQSVSGVSYNDKPST